jgi:hypothetical protein
MSTTVAPEDAQATNMLADSPLDIAAHFPADPDIMVSPERDIRGLDALQNEVRFADSDGGVTTEA